MHWRTSMRIQAYLRFLLAWTLLTCGETCAGDGRASPIPENAGELVKPTPTMEQLLQQAFGENCRELQFCVKIHLPKRGLILVADGFTIEPDGRVKLEPFGIVRFPNTTGLRSRHAYFEMDKPVSNA